MERFLIFFPLVALVCFRLATAESLLEADELVACC